MPRGVLVAEGLQDSDRTAEVRREARAAAVPPFCPNPGGLRAALGLQTALRGGGGGGLPEDAVAELRI